ncbi:MAG: Nif3-like dinuclear metal center hexameric protein [Rubrivivax sp.]|nr:Nif3-like dinuclear metal center hexameric protein [Rubrivivax sp.]
MARGGRLSHGRRARRDGRDDVGSGPRRPEAPQAQWAVPIAKRNDIEAALAGLMKPEAFRDYGPNGLQVEGRTEVRRLVSGVTASLAFIDAAIAADADALLVHHGLFWRGHDGRLTGWLRERVARLLAHDINLFAYHLPLDAEPTFGNNAQFGLRLKVQADERFGEQDLGFIGAAGPWRGQGADALAEAAAAALGRAPLLVAGDGRRLERVAWCTGGAQGYFEAAIAAGADVFLTGEISEPQAHLARETGVAFIACGHHATERFGAPAVAAHIAASLGIEHRFIEIDNPA